MKEAKEPLLKLVKKDGEKHKVVFLKKKKNKQKTWLLCADE